MLRRVMRHWATGVAVVTSALGEVSHGMTVNSFVSVSLDPPLVTVTMNNDAYTFSLIQQSGIFGVTILSRFQQNLAERFAGRYDENEDRMAGLNLFTMQTGAPFLQDGVAFLDCRVVHSYAMLHSTLIIGEVQATRLAGEDLPPLIYVNRTFTGLVD